MENDVEYFWGLENRKSWNYAAAHFEAVLSVSNALFPPVIWVKTLNARMHIDCDSVFPLKWLSLFIHIRHQKVNFKR